MTRSDTQMSRVTRSKKECRAAYDRLSRWYEVIAGRSEKRLRDAGLQQLGAREGETVLEIGCGTGYCAHLLAQRVGGSGKVYGIDMSRGMCDTTRARVKDVGLSEAVILTCGDAAELPFESDFFDAVFMSFTLELFDTPEIPAVLRECQRVMQGGGRIGVVAMSKEGNATVMRWLYEWLHKKLPTWVDCRPIFVRRMLEDAGFQVVEAAKLSMFGLSVEIVLAKNA